MHAFPQLALMVLASISGLGDALELGIICANAGGEVRVVVTATNISGSTLEFCGYWRPRFTFVPGEECGQRYAALEAKIDRERAQALAEGKRYFSRCLQLPEPPFFIAASGLVWNGDYTPYLINLEPRAAYADTFDFTLGPEDYQNCAGWIEVRYDLEFCDQEIGDAIVVPQNALGGRVSVSLPVPWGNRLPSVDVLQIGE